MGTALWASALDGRHASQCTLVKYNKSEKDFMGQNVETEHTAECLPFINEHSAA